MKVFINSVYRLLKKMSFDDVLKVANKYFKLPVGEKRSFTHCVGMGKVDFWLYFMKDNVVDFEYKLENLNKLYEKCGLAKEDWSKFGKFICD